MERGPWAGSGRLPICHRTKCWRTRDIITWAVRRGWRVSGSPSPYPDWGWESRGRQREVRLGGSHESVREAAPAAAVGGQLHEERQGVHVGLHSSQQAVKVKTVQLYVARPVGTMVMHSLCYLCVSWLSATENAVKAVSGAVNANR